MSSRGAEVVVRILAKPGCPLCDEMKGAAEVFRMWYGFRVEVEDVTADAGAMAEHGQSVPVVFVDGRLACKGRMEPARFARMLEEAGARRPRD